MAFGEKKHGFGGLFGKESATSYEVYLNLTPLMDVMSNILFFLLAAFGASVVAILPTTVPVRSDDSSVETAVDRVTVTLRVEADVLTVGCDSGTIPEDTLRSLGARIPKRGGQYDSASLTRVLMRIKQRYPASKTLVMVPDDGIRYEELVKLMDASRDRGEGRRRVNLFPEVVLSGIAPAAPGDDASPTGNPSSSAPLAPAP